MSTEPQAITPSLPKYLKSLRTSPADASIDHLVLLIRRKQIKGSRACALATAHVYESLISTCTLKTASQLLDDVRAIGIRLQAAAPHELVLGNIARRVLGLIREAYETPADAEKDDVKPKSGQRKSANQPVDLLAGLDGTPNDPAKHVPVENVKEDVLEGLGLLLDELRAADGQVADSALDHIHAHETVLTYGSSLTVQRFLLGAAKRRKFTVIQVEGYPNQQDVTYDTVVNGLSVYDDEKDARQRLRSLLKAEITVIVVPESAVFAVMSQVSKVFLPVGVGFPNGGFVGAAGCGMVAQAAKTHGVPVVALGAVYKLSPVFPHDPDQLVEMGDPGRVLGYGSGELPEEVEVLNPVSEYVGPDLVDLFVTNIGGHAPNYLYRIVADHYRAEDVELDASEKGLNGG